MRSPACIISFFVTALAHGDLKEAWDWSDDPEKPNEEPGAEKNAAMVAASPIPDKKNGSDASKPQLGPQHQDSDADGSVGDDDSTPSSPKRNRRRGKKKKV